MTTPSPEQRPRKQRRMGRVWGMSLFAFVILAAPPLLGWYLLDAPVAHAEFKNDTNPRANYWRDVREGVAGYTTAKGQETGKLINNGGENWRQMRNGPIATIGAWLIAVFVILLAAFHLMVGKAKLAQRTGRKVLRWTLFERILHWFVAVLFIILALTGLSLLYGRAVMIPMFGYTGFAAYAQFCKVVHDYLSLLFLVGLVIMLAIWVRENVISKVDIEWFKKGGGYLGKGHAHAHKVNGGEKIWFWILFIAGIGLMVSGFVLLFPNLGFLRETMQGANIIHGITALILSAFALGHIYLGTIGNEGTLEGMIHGEVDEAWAKQHHDLWYEETRGHGRSAAGSAAKGQAPQTG